MYTPVVENIEEHCKQHSHSTHTHSLFHLRPSFKVTVHSRTTPSAPAHTNVNTLSVGLLFGDTCDGVKGQKYHNVTEKLFS